MDQLAVDRQDDVALLHETALGGGLTCKELLDADKTLSRVGVGALAPHHAEA